jgi:type 2 lantibiotic biosynthesis protein LanM
VDHEDTLTVSAAIGDRLLNTAIVGQGDATWIGLALINERAFDLAPLQLDLYDGLPGIALYLAYLGMATGEDRYRDMAMAAMRSVVDELPRARNWLKQLGAFTGWGGIVHTLTHLGVMWDRADLLQEAITTAKLVPELAAADPRFDVVSGAAGCIPPLLNLYRRTRTESVLDAAVRCGERLVTTAKTQESGRAWPDRNPGGKPGGGFAHGASGIAWALFELAAATNSPHFAELARAAVAYERSLYSAEAENWEDLRWAGGPEGPARSRKRHFGMAWCHGAPGIALARLLSLPHHDDPDVRAEIGVALRTTAREGFGRSHCLCHGDLGNLDVLQIAASRLVDARWREAFDAVRGRLLQELLRSGPRYANPGGVESPGLMTGLSGIGYALLRLAAPQQVPSVLGLESPR